jgi:hypothetical protein
MVELRGHRAGTRDEVGTLGAPLVGSGARETRGPAGAGATADRRLSIALP